jgi:GAF domain-containing protein
VDPIAEGLAEAARDIGKQDCLEDTLQAIVEAAQRSLSEFNEVGISITDRDGRIFTRAATGQLVWDLDSLQYELGEGPCVDAIRGEPVVDVPAIRHDQRWPRYVEHAVKEHGLRSQLAVRLWLDDEGTVGGLNIYSTTSDSVPDEDVRLASLFAAHAAVAFGKAQTIEDLTKALESRRIIGQAVGLLMAEYGIDDDAAFGFLRRASSYANVKLRDVAARIVEDANKNPGRRSTGHLG